MADTVGVSFPLWGCQFPDSYLGQSLLIWHPQLIQFKSTDLDSNPSSATHWLCHVRPPSRSLFSHEKIKRGTGDRWFCLPLPMAQWDRKGMSIKAPEGEIKTQKGYVTHMWLKNMSSQWSREKPPSRRCLNRSQLSPPFETTVFMAQKRYSDNMLTLSCYTFKVSTFKISNLKHFP